MWVVSPTDRPLFLRLYDRLPPRRDESISVFSILVLRCPIRNRNRILASLLDRAVGQEDNRVVLFSLLRAAFQVLSVDRNKKSFGCTKPQSLHNLLVVLLAFSLLLLLVVVRMEVVAKMAMEFVQAYCKCLPVFPWSSETSVQCYLRVLIASPKTIKKHLPEAMEFRPLAQSEHA